MDIYFAGGRGHFSKSKTTYGINKLLYSYIELNTKRRLNKLLPYIRWFKRNGGKVFLDSGAYSAYTLGFKININDYISFVKNYKDNFDVIASLDVIGNDMQSYENYMDMRRAGCDYVIPVHHAKDNIEYLHKYIGLTDYIAFGGFAQLRAMKPVVANLDKLFTHISLDKNNYPSKKIHLFGISNTLLLKRYALKIYSLDSSSWVSATRWGEIILKNGKTYRFKDAKKTMYGDHAEKWLFYNVISLLNIEKTLNEYIEKHRSNVPNSIRN